MKIKLAGDDLPWDVDRVLSVERVAAEAQATRGCTAWHYSADFNEKCANVEYVLDFLAKIGERSPAALERLQYIEQPTHRDLRANPENRMHRAAEIKPIVIDESLVDLESLLLSREMGYSGVALKTCKGHSGALLMAAAAQKYGMFLCVQDLTCPGASFLHSASLAARIPGVAAIEGNAPAVLPSRQQRVGRAFSNHISHHRRRRRHRRAQWSPVWGTNRLCVNGGTKHVRRHFNTNVIWQSTTSRNGVRAHFPRVIVLVILLICVNPFAGHLWAQESNSCHLVLPPVIYAVAGTEVNLYFQNLILTPPGRVWIFDVTCAKGTQQVERWTWVPKEADVGDLPLGIEVRDADDKVAAKGQTTIRVASAKAGIHQPLRLICIGDSGTHASAYTAELMKLCAWAGSTEAQVDRHTSSALCWRGQRA